MLARDVVFPETLEPDIKTVMLPVLLKTYRAEFPPHVLRPTAVECEKLLNPRPIHTRTIAAENHFLVAQALYPLFEANCKLGLGHATFATLKQRQHVLDNPFRAQPFVVGVGKLRIKLTAILGGTADTDQSANTFIAGSGKFGIEKDLHD